MCLFCIIIYTNISDEIRDLIRDEVRHLIHELQPKTDNLKCVALKDGGSKVRSTTRKSTNLSKDWKDILWNTWDEFWKRTTISGMSNARKSNSGFRRTIWMTFFAIFTVFTFIGLSNVIDDYKTYPVTTSVTVKHNDQVNQITFYLHTHR